MRSVSPKALACALAVGVALPASVFATNGYFLIGYGSKSRSMGGAGVAYGQDALAGAANPAAMADLDVSTMRIDAGAELFVPKRGFVHDSATLESGFPGSDTGVNHRSGSNVFPIPTMGGVYKFSRKLTRAYPASQPALMGIRLAEPGLRYSTSTVWVAPPGACRSFRCRCCRVWRTR